MIINGNTVGTPMPRANWDQTDPKKADYIKGKEKVDEAIKKAQDDAGEALKEVTPIERGGHGGTTAEEARANLGITPQNIGAVSKQDVIPVEKGGHGGTTAEEARANLGITPENIGAVGTDAVIPVDRGGTGGTTPEAARANLGAAPAGFGLGTAGELKDVTTFDELNALTKNGWYFVRFAEPFSIDGQTAQFICVEVNAITEQHVHQTLHLIGSNYKLHRYSDNGVWYPLEWVNPPMMAGVEYRTTERANGDPVYTKLIDCGYCPSGVTTTISVPLGRVPIRFAANDGSWSALPRNMETEWKVDVLLVCNDRIEVRCGPQGSSVMFIQVWYIK